MIKYINGNDFEKEVLSREDIVLVDFFATWCPPCKKLGEELEKLERSRADIDIVKINIDDNKDIAMNYEIMYVPTIIVFKNGKPVVSNTGFMKAEDVINLIEKVK